MSETAKICFLIQLVSRVSPNGWDPPTTQKIGLFPHVFPTVFHPKCYYCKFHAVFSHYAQIVTPTSRPHLGNPGKPALLPK